MVGGGRARPARNASGQNGADGGATTRELPLLAALLPGRQAGSEAEATAIVLARPVPVSSFRCVSPSFTLSAWISSSTSGAAFLITISSHFPHAERQEFGWVCGFPKPGAVTSRWQAGPLTKSVVPGKRTAQISVSETWVVK
jgi:hypothetical protein